jgi:hypothetical protein
MNRGYPFENESVTWYREFFGAIWPKNMVQISGSFYRVEGGGRNKLATKTGGKHSVLEGDVILRIGEFFDSIGYDACKHLIPFEGILQENKHYKSKSEQKSFTIEKEWLDQARDEALKNSMLSVVAIKFKGINPRSKLYKEYRWYGVDGNSVHYMIPHEDWLKLLAYICTLNKVIEKASASESETKTQSLSTYSTEDLLAELKTRMR